MLARSGEKYYTVKAEKETKNGIFPTKAEAGQALPAGTRMFGGRCKALNQEVLKYARNYQGDDHRGNSEEEPGCGADFDGSRYALSGMPVRSGREPGGGRNGAWH